MASGTDRRPRPPDRSPDSHWRRCSRRTSAAHRRRRSWSVTWPRTERDPRTPIALARELVDGVGRHRDSIDAEIDRRAPQYPVTSLARMDRALLRSAIGEVLHSATPARVAIAEWVELARTYSGDPMRRLMNGVLGSIAAEPNGDRPSA